MLRPGPVPSWVHRAAPGVYSGAPQVGGLGRLRRRAIASRRRLPARRLRGTRPDESSQPGRRPLPEGRAVGRRSHLALGSPAARPLRTGLRTSPERRVEYVGAERRRSPVLAAMAASANPFGDGRRAADPTPTAGRVRCLGAEAEHPEGDSVGWSRPATTPTSARLRPGPRVSSQPRRGGRPRRGQDHRTGRSRARAPNSSIAMLVGGPNWAGASTPRRPRPSPASSNGAVWDRARSRRGRFRRRCDASAPPRRGSIRSLTGARTPDPPAEGTVVTTRPRSATALHPRSHRPGPTPEARANGYLRVRARGHQRQQAAPRVRSVRERRRGAIQTERRGARPGRQSVRASPNGPDGLGASDSGISRGRPGGATNPRRPRRAAAPPAPRIPTVVLLRGRCCVGCGLAPGRPGGRPPPSFGTRPVQVAAPPMPQGRGRLAVRPGRPPADCRGWNR